MDDPLEPMRDRAERDMRGRIEFVPARDMVGRKLFGDDWIDRLAPGEEKLLEKYCPSFVVEPFPERRQALRLTSVIGIIEPCPTALRSRLDQALGRCLRMNGQRITAEDWLKQKGPPVQLGSYDRKALLKAIAKINQPAEKPGRGRRSELTDRVERDMRAQLDDSTLTMDELTGMKQKDLAARFDCSEFTARNARDRVVAAPKLNSKQ